MPALSKLEPPDLPFLALVEVEDVLEPAGDGLGRAHPLCHPGASHSGPSLLDSEEVEEEPLLPPFPLFPSPPDFPDFPLLLEELLLLLEELSLEIDSRTAGPVYPPTHM
eukprot:CAMPEP_0201638448 /NCGR_PEP_ID=MMETSP0493-20130528/16554_1 /ASSEMBLY_ACC=CAM_ASM_000838 /TAXON_ID=420259 /ORGANISM="Thalassiosira gravida, Strain GMp14c1" /LENGTH=108 /DNA_ID=CAMNT_0048111471 /DNA_START=162 /DNA_END=489 /DNA_ORIENTATION=+